MLARMGLVSAFVATALSATAALADISTATPNDEAGRLKAATTLDQLAAKKCRYTERYILSNKLCQLDTWRDQNPDCAKRYC